MAARHKQVLTEIDGRSIAVDEGVAELIQVLNAIPGITTIYSCQGDGIINEWEANDWGYVQFAGDQMFPFLSEVMVYIWREERKRRKLAFSPTFRSGGTIGTMTLRWHLRDYEAVLRIAKKIKKDWARHGRDVRRLLLPVFPRGAAVGGHQLERKT